MLLFGVVFAAALTPPKLSLGLGLVNIFWLKFLHCYKCYNLLHLLALANGNNNNKTLSHSAASQWQTLVCAWALIMQEMMQFLNAEQVRNERKCLREDNVMILL